MTIPKQPKNRPVASKTGIKSLALKAIPAVIGVMLLLGWAGWKSLMAPVVSESDGAGSKEIRFTVKPGVSGNEIGAQLAQAGLIKSVSGWKAWTKLKQVTDSSGGFKAGSYEISPQEPLAEIASKIWSGKNSADRFHYSRRLVNHTDGRIF